MLLAEKETHQYPDVTLSGFVINGTSNLPVTFGSPILLPEIDFTGGTCFFLLAYPSSRMMMTTIRLCTSRSSCCFRFLLKEER